MLIVISALISLFAQFLVNSRFSKYSRVRSRSGMTGAQAAYDVLCWDGSCVSVMEGELTTRRPPAPKPNPWGRSPTGPKRPWS